MVTKASRLEKLGNSFSGFELREMFSVATRWLEKNATAIDALNVFPVPDGDTGTNMLLTMRAATDEAARVSENNASVIAQALARGALMGARGNSGVILSQIFKGIAQGLDNLVSFGPKEMIRALQGASSAAYKGLSKPVEGTMLTVIKDVSDTVKKASVNGKELASLMEIAVREAKSSVERTPELLDVLKEAGVVDAGGQGLYIMLEGALHYLRGNGNNIRLLQPEITPATLPPALKVAGPGKHKEKIYGYCTEFIIKGNKINPDRIRKKMETKGDSVMVVGDKTTVRIHIHTPDPGAVLKFGTSVGSLHDLKIQNMDDQHEEFLQMRRALVPAVKIATVVVASGEGLEDVFRSLGATAIVPGGQTMNPSTEELLRAIEFVPSEKVIILPNNKNVILTAQQAASLSRKRVEVLATQSIPQGIAALLAFNNEVELKTNLSEMEQARQRVKSFEVTRAVRSTKAGKLRVKKGQHIGFMDGELKAAGDNVEEVIDSSLNGAGVEKAELVTLYYGADVKGEEAESLAEFLRREHSNLQVEVINGGQPHYSYIISLE